MTLPALPCEIVYKIFSYVPLKELKYLFRRLPLDDLLRLVIGTILYERVVVRSSSCYSMDYYHQILPDELYELSKEKSPPKVQFLKIDGKCPPAITSGYLESIDKVSLLVDTIDDYRANARLDNVVELELLSASLFTMKDCPPRLESITLRYNENDLSPVLTGWPKSLKRLDISFCQDVSKISLPHNLEELSCHYCSKVWTEYPPTLKSLDMSLNFGLKFDQFILPDLLYKLRLRNCHIDNIDWLTKKWPMELRCLDIGNNPQIFMNEVTFPESLVTLNILLCKIKSLNSVKFPSLLIELCVADNELETLENVNFPNLSVLDISRWDHYEDVQINKICQAKFPTSLRRLFADGHKIEDWSEVTFPNELVELTIDSTEDLEKLVFPPNLESLQLNLFTDSKPCYSNLHLPPTLQLLLLHGGLSIDFDWNLPNLSFMSVVDVVGPIQIPSSVKELELETMDSTTFESLIIPQGVEELTITYPLSAYPDTVIDLQIQYCDPSKPLILPLQLRSLCLFAGTLGPISREQIVLPPSIQQISGDFELEFIETINDLGI